MKKKKNIAFPLLKLFKLFLVKYALPILSVGALTLIRYYLHERFGYHIPLLFYTIIIFLHAVIGGFDSGLLTTLISVLAARFLFPNTHLNAEQISEVYAFFYILQGLIISFLVHRIVKTTKKIRRINKNLFHNEKLLKNTIDSLLSGILIIKPNGEIIDANKTFLSMVASNLDDLEDESVYSLELWSHSKPSQEKLAQAIEKVLNGETEDYEDILMTPSNNYINAAVSIVLVEDEIDETKYLIIAIRDITERVSYQKELERIKLSYSRLVDSNIIGMCIRDREGHIIDSNDAFLDIIGYSREDIELQKFAWDNLIPKEFKVKHELADQTMMTKGYTEPIEKEYIRKDGRRVPVILSGVQIDPESKEFLCLILDMSYRKELEKKKDEFISMASHELKTPLTSLKGYSQLLYKNIGQNIKFAEILNNQVSKLTVLINELLDVSKIESGKITLTKTHFDINELIQETIQEVQPLSMKHTIIFDTKEKIIVEADKTRIGQVITNLLTNAIKYSPDADKIRIFTKIANDKVRVNVQDFGPGIPENKKENIFEKFYRAEKDSDFISEGLGLGLYISSEIVERHNSKINVGSEIGQGSIFSFDLPLVKS